MAVCNSVFLHELLVYVKLLRRDDARNELGEQVPIDTSMLPRTSCATAANTLLADMLARTRTVMAEFIVKTTTSWREGQPQAPFALLGAPEGIGGPYRENRPELS